MAEQRQARVLIVKASLDGHWRGVAVVTRALRDAGMEVIYGGVMSPEEIVAAAMQEDVDAIGVNIEGGYGVVAELMQLLSKEQGFRPLVVAGGTVPRPDIRLLKEMGVSEVFPPGSALDAITQHIKSRLAGRARSVRLDPDTDSGGGHD